MTTMTPRKEKELIVFELKLNNGESTIVPIYMEGYEIPEERGLLFELTMTKHLSMCFADEENFIAGLSSNISNIFELVQISSITSVRFYGIFPISQYRMAFTIEDDEPILNVIEEVEDDAGVLSYELEKIELEEDLLD